MKIFLVGPVYPYRGGIAHYNASLAQALVDAGHSVRVISFRRQYPARLYPGKSDKDPSSDPLRFPAEYLLDPLYPWTWLRTINFIQKEQPDLLVIHWWTTFWAPAYTILVWNLRRKVKVVYLIHNVMPHESKPWDRWLAYIALRQGQAYIVQTQHEHERLSNLIPNLSQVSIFPHPAYHPFEKQPLPKDIARQLLGLHGDQPLLLCFGIVRPYKGLKYLLEALSQVRQPVHLIVAGEFWDEIDVYQKQIEDLALSQKVTLLNRYIPNDEAHTLFSAADGLVAPYVGGTQSGAVGLALGYGLPIIVTEKVAEGLPTFDIAEPLEEKPRQVSGYTQIIPSANPLALAQAIENLITRLPNLKNAPLSATEDWSRLVQVIEEIEKESK
jgi:glycosyltransferase involved in cell wall biosynthesis